MSDDSDYEDDSETKTQTQISKISENVDNVFFEEKSCFKNSKDKRHQTGVSKRKFAQRTPKPKLEKPKDSVTKGVSQKTEKSEENEANFLKRNSKFLESRHKMGSFNNMGDISHILKDTINNNFAEGVHLESAKKKPISPRTSPACKKASKPAPIYPRNRPKQANKATRDKTSDNVNFWSEAKDESTAEILKALEARPVQTTELIVTENSPQRPAKKVKGIRSKNIARNFSKVPEYKQEGGLYRQDHRYSDGKTDDNAFGESPIYQTYLRNRSCGIYPKCLQYLPKSNLLIFGSNTQYKQNNIHFMRFGRDKKNRPTVDFNVSVPVTARLTRVVTNFSNSTVMLCFNTSMSCLLEVRKRTAKLRNIEKVVSDGTCFTTENQNDFLKQALIEEDTFQSEKGNFPSLNIQIL